MIDDNLDKTIASIEEWKTGEHSRLSSEKAKLEAQTSNLSKNSSIFGALGF